MIPNFKNEDYFKGIDRGTTEIIKLIDDPVYAEEFANNPDINKEPVSLTVKLISSFFLTVLFFVFGILGYNQVVAKKSYKKIKFKSLFKERKTKFFTAFLVLYCLGLYFYTYFWYAFLGLIILAFFSIFVGIGFIILFKGAFKLSVSNFKGLFTGKLGLINFIFYIPFVILFFFAGFVFTFMPILMAVMGITEVIFDTRINDFMQNVTFYNVLFVFISIVALFFIISCVVAIKKIQNTLKDSFGFSFFTFDKSFFKSFKNGSSRGYSSSGSSSYSSRSSSSSSRSSFSGGGGRSSGGGASGSW